MADGIRAHEAAIPSVARSVVDPVTSHRANVDATLNVLVPAREAGVHARRLAGSSSVYGDTAVLPKRETMTVNPLSPYALQKAIGEQYLHLFNSLYGCLRLRLGTSTCSARGRILRRPTPV